MSIDAEASAIVEIANDNAGTIGLTTAYDPPHPVLNSSQLPSLWCLTGEATYDRMADDIVIVTRVYNVSVAVLGVDHGDARERETRVRPILDALYQTYFKFRSLENTTGVQDAYPLGDSGVVLLPDYNQAFIGCQMQLRVVSYIERTYVDYDQ